MIELGKEPSQRLVDFICILAGGRFISREKLQEFKQIRFLSQQAKRDLERERQEKEALQKEVENLRQQMEKQSVEKEAFSRNFESIKNKIEQETVSAKKDVGGIVEFD